MHVRRAGPAEAERIVAILAEVAEEGRWIGTEAPVVRDERVPRVLADLESGAAVMWVLEEQGRVVGSVGLHATAATGVLSLGTAIVAEARGRGGGRALLATAVDHALASPAHKLELEVWPHNGRAIGLYAAHGFVVEGVRRDHYRRRDGSLWSALVMARSVSA